MIVEALSDTDKAGVAAVTESETVAEALVYTPDAACVAVIIASPTPTIVIVDPAMETTLVSLLV
ncbi:MAG: hypothetical protein EBT09_07050 [Actinobacteria bacterium]|nr:hypothetical protein [Actinomycetota bacterium]